MRLPWILFLLLFIPACKDSVFSSKSERNSTRGNSQDGTGKNQRGETDGTDGSGFQDGSDGSDGSGKGGKDGSDGSDSGGGGKSDSGKGDNGDSGDSGGGKDGKDGKDDTDGDDDNGGSKNPHVINNGTVEIGEDDVGTDGGELTGQKAVLKLIGLRNDDGGSSIEVTRADGKVRTGQWPGKGQTVEIADVCNRTKTKLKIKVTFKGKSFEPSNPKCFVGKEVDKKTLHIGFEEDCDSTSFNQIDDTIATWSCPQSDLTIETLRMDNGINMTDWLK